MSDFDSSSEYLARAADSAGEGRLTFRSVFLGLVVLYVVIAAVSIGVLIFKVPVSAEELQHATWLVGTVSFFVFGPVMACRQAGPDFHQVGLMNRSPYRIAN
ncbi:hypothetical protein [Pseudomonas sp. NBRC 111132]|uniref:hypothetical protein n=1 Tax=Pseudomonas sp. NBRC 111132 TaxID=1661047 RepID=UPI00076172CF|nr:hypothetical protein [Pseudomonas sp. NBRC 111132]